MSVMDLDRGLILCVFVAFLCMHSVSPQQYPTDKEFYTVDFGRYDSYPEPEDFAGALTLDISSEFYGAVLQPFSTFNFSFFDWRLPSLYIMTWGFLSVAPVTNDYMYNQELIAPFLSELDPSAHNTSLLHLAYQDNIVYIWWTDMYHANLTSLGPFSFQVQLHGDGSVIKFLYKTLPSNFADILDESMLNIGLSDAFTDSQQNPPTTGGTFNLIEHNRVRVNFSALRSGDEVTLTPVQGECMNHLVDDECVTLYRMQTCTTKASWMNRHCYCTCTDPPDIYGDRDEDSRNETAYDNGWVTIFRYWDTNEYEPYNKNDAKTSSTNPETTKTTTTPASPPKELKSDDNEPSTKQSTTEPPSSTTEEDEEEQTTMDLEDGPDSIVARGSRMTCSTHVVVITLLLIQSMLAPPSTSTRPLLF